MTKKEKAERHFMFHDGQATVTTAAVTRTVIDPKTGEEKTIIETPEKSEKITLTRGASFGDYPIGQPVEVNDPKIREALAAKGYKDYKPTKKDGIDTEAPANGLSGKLAEVAERDRQRALGRIRRMGDSADKLDPAAKKLADDEAKDGETLGSDEGGK